MYCKKNPTIFPPALPKKYANDRNKAKTVRKKNFLTFAEVSEISIYNSVVLLGGVLGVGFFCIIYF